MNWADYFPEMQYTNTSDSRVFKTAWEKIKRGDQKVKVRAYFASPVMGVGYKVDIVKPWAVDSKESEKEALDKMIAACDYFEAHNVWPQNSPKNNEAS